MEVGWVIEVTRGSYGVEGRSSDSISESFMGFRIHPWGVSRYPILFRVEDEKTLERDKVIQLEGWSSIS